MACAVPRERAKAAPPRLNRPLPSPESGSVSSSFTMKQLISNGDVVIPDGEQWLEQLGAGGRGQGRTQCGATPQPQPTAAAWPRAACHRAHRAPRANGSGSSSRAVFVLPWQQAVRGVAATTRHRQQACPHRQGWSCRAACGACCCVRRAAAAFGILVQLTARRRSSAAASAHTSHTLRVWMSTCSCSGTHRSCTPTHTALPAQPQGPAAQQRLPRPGCSCCVRCRSAHSSCSQGEAGGWRG
jgi:hypothetical protein